MSGELKRVINAQQRTLSKYERNMSSIRQAPEDAMKLPIDAGNFDYQQDAMKRGAAFAITDSGEVKGVYIPIETLQKLGLLNG